MPEASTLSRRRILTGAAWAAPVVLVASALPAAAASPPVLGGLTLVSSSGYQTSSVLTVSTYVSYVGDGAPSPDHPVSAISVTITVPTARVAAGAGSTSSAGWVYTSRSISGSNTLFVFTWTGVNLSGSTTSTSQLVATLPKAASRASLSVTLRALGTSNGSPVQSAPATLVIAAHSVLTISTAFAVTRDAYGTDPRYMRSTAQIKNDSAAPSSNTAVIVGVVARVTVPTAMVGGSGTPGVVAGPWTYSSVATSGSNSIYTFTCTTASIPASASAITANFRIPMTGFYFATPTISVTFEGYSPSAGTGLTSVSGSDTLDL